MRPLTSSTEDRPETETLVRENIGWMLQLAERLLLDRALAEDAVQEAFVAAFRGLEDYQARSSLKTWLHRITANAALMKLRQLKRLAESPIDDFLPEFDSNDCRIESDWPRLLDTETLVENEARRDAVRAAIEKLPDPYRIVLQLRDIDGYDTNEVGDLFGDIAGQREGQTPSGSRRLEKVTRTAASR